MYRKWGVRMKTIITIGRQAGSGGREIGEKLANALGIPCYDKSLLYHAAKDSGFCEEIFETHDEKPTRSFLYSLVMDTHSFGYSPSLFSDMPLNHKIFLAQFDAIKKLAEEGGSVMVGRCADYALENNENCIRVFIYAPLEDRIARVSKIREMSYAKTKDMIIKTDKQRASYYNYYTNKKWGDPQSYDICINSSLLGIDGTVALIKSIVEKKTIL